MEIQICVCVCPEKMYFSTALKPPHTAAGMSEHCVCVHRESKGQQKVKPLTQQQGQRAEVKGHYGRISTCQQFSPLWSQSMSVSSMTKN